MLRLMLSGIVASLMMGATGSDDPPRVVRPLAKVQTDPVPSDGDAADDPSIWIHPQDPSLSLVIASDKKGGLHAYDIEGHERQRISPGSKPNNVDLIYGFPLPGREPVDLAVATVGKGGRSGVKVWTIDRATGQLAELGDGPTFATFGGGDPYGICTYRSPRDGSHSVFVTDRAGQVEQYRLQAATEGMTLIQASRVRAFAVGSQAEGIVADRETGRLYIAEENLGIWEYGAEPVDGSDRSSVAKVGEHGLTADVEGLTIYYAPGGKGYLLASSQGSNTFLAYERAGRHDYVLTIEIPAGALDGVAGTDGIDVTNERTSPRFPHGFLVVQDGENVGRQNFKLIDWDDIAGRTLIIDPSLSARAGR